MSTATKHKVWTYADLEAMPESEDGTRHEIIDGELVVTASPIPFHQSLSLEATLRIAGVVRSGDLGRILAAPIDVEPPPSRLTASADPSARTPASPDPAARDHPRRDRLACCANVNAGR